MIKNVRLFVNDDEKSIKFGKIVKKNFMDNGFRVVDGDNFSLGIAIGGDGSFIRMVRENHFNSELYYVGINTGHLGFLQEVNPDDIDKLVQALKNDTYQIDYIGVQETIVYYDGKRFSNYTLNEVLIKEKDSDIFTTRVYIGKSRRLRDFGGDGIMLSTSVGSTAHALGYGGAIVYPTFSSLQMVPIAPMPNSRYRSLRYPFILPSGMWVCLKPKISNVSIAFDGQNKVFENIESISSCVRNDKKIKRLILNKSSFIERINEKLI